MRGCKWFWSGEEVKKKSIHMYSVQNLYIYYRNNCNEYKILNNYIIITKLKNSDNNQAELANSKSAKMREEGGGWGK